MTLEKLKGILQIAMGALILTIATMLCLCLLWLAWFTAFTHHIFKEDTRHLFDGLLAFVCLLLATCCPYFVVCVATFKPGSTK